jgi:hypothetical protein
MRLIDATRQIVRPAPDADADDGFRIPAPPRFPLAPPEAFPMRAPRPRPPAALLLRLAEPKRRDERI